MRAFLLVLLLVPVRAHEATARAHEATARAHEATAGAAEYAFDYACRALKADCTNINPPRVMFGPLTAWYGWYGVFWSGTASIVWLDLSFEQIVVDMKFEPGFEILVHETVHYVEYHLGTLQPGCAGEEVAWRIGNLWLLEYGHGDKARWDWRRAYRVC